MRERWILKSRVDRGDFLEEAAFELGFKDWHGKCEAGKRGGRWYEMKGHQ